MMKVLKVESENASKIASLVAVNHDDTTTLLIEQWIAEADVQPKTQCSYRGAAKFFTSWLDGNGELTEARLIEYREFLKGSKAATTARLYFGLAKQFTGWLAKRGYIQRNVAFGVKTVKIKNDHHNRDAVAPEEIAQCLATFDTSTLKGKRDKAIFATLAGCGLRSIEICRLKVGSIEKRGKNWAMKIWGKGRSGAVDTVILPLEVKALIDDYLKARGKAGKGEPLFTSTSRSNRGQELQTQSVSKMCKATFRAIGIDSPRVNCHSLRHSNITIALNEKVDIDSVALNARHASTATTAVYRHDTKILTNPTNSIVAGVIFKALGELMKGAKQNEG